MGRQGAIGRDDGPVVRLDASVVAAEGEHRLDGEAQAGLELAAWTTGPEVRDLWLLVHLGPDAVADELADDAEVRLRRNGLDCGRDVLDVVARHGRRDAGHHRAA